jgi:hypothetical protein
VVGGSRLSGPAGSIVRHATTDESSFPAGVEKSPFGETLRKTAS